MSKFHQYWSKIVTRESFENFKPDFCTRLIRISGFFCHLVQLHKKVYPQSPHLLVQVAYSLHTVTSQIMQSYEIRETVLQISIDIDRQIVFTPCLQHGFSVKTLPTIHAQKKKQNSICKVWYTDDSPSKTNRPLRQIALSDKSPSNTYAIFYEPEERAIRPS